jgi:hypothetical protein
MDVGLQIVARLQDGVNRLSRSKPQQLSFPIEIMMEPFFKLLLFAVMPPVEIPCTRFFDAGIRVGSPRKSPEKSGIILAWQH